MEMGLNRLEFDSADPALGSKFKQYGELHIQTKRIASSLHSLNTLEFSSVSHQGWTFLNGFRTVSYQKVWNSANLSEQLFEHLNSSDRLQL